jgi:xanthine/CO dehydrogenase XdhC/CoxF family maturation factor
MGCNGVVRILLERISVGNNYLKFLEDCVLSWRGSGVAATLISSANKHQIGSRLLYAGGRILTSDFDVDFQEKLLPYVQNAFVSERSQLKTYDAFEVFVEFIKPTVSLFIFGAGADAVPLCDFAKNLGWNVEVLDHRSAFATKERFPKADFVKVFQPNDFAGFMPDGGNYFAVVMTHNYGRDKEIIWRLLNTEARYIGALGPKKRTENILRELAEEGRDFPAGSLPKLYAPVGLDIGADTPEGIALSIVAEIQAVLANRAGGFLRDRNGSIYGRNQT